jgi:hypothetical protein
MDIVNNQVGDALEPVVVPHPATAWVGCDRLGNLIQVTHGAFGMSRREHVWKLNHNHPNEAGRLTWTLIADNVSEIPASRAITCSF